MLANTLVMSFLLGAYSVASAATFDVRIPSEFSKVVDTNQPLNVLGEGFGWIEGPVWVPQQGGYLIFSDQTNKRMHRWSAADGVTIFRDPSRGANGNTLDLNERLLTCETDSRVVVRTETNGELTTLVSRYNNKTFNAPNDVVVESDGTVWFTDPNYGSGQTQPGRYVFRFSPENGNGTVAVAVTNFTQPNGLCFSPDEKKLYIADSDQARHHIRVFDVLPDKTLTNSRTFCTIGNGVPDGIRCDSEGRVYSSSADGVQIFLPDGRLIGKILTTDTSANLCFGGPDYKTLFIVARPKLYSIRMNVAGTAILRKLKLSRTGDKIELRWPAPSTGFQLEASGDLQSWSPLGLQPTLEGAENRVTGSITNAAKWFRLRHNL